MEKTVFSVGEVARITQLAPRTIATRFDRGMLKGYLVPGSRHRRITREALLAFMEKHGIPADRLQALEKEEAASSGSAA